MRKEHIIMFACQIIMNILLSFLLFDGLLSENGIFAFIYPFFSIIFLLVDIFFTMITTDIIVRISHNETVCIISIIVRDLLIIIVWLCFLLYIDINVLTLWGTLCFAFPKIVKIVICDIINKQKYLHKYIEI